MSMRISHLRARRREMPRQMIRPSAAPLATLRLQMFAAGRTIVVITKNPIVIGATNAIIPQTAWIIWKSTFHVTIVALLPKVVAHLLFLKGGPVPPTLPVERPTV